MLELCVRVGVCGRRRLCSVRCLCRSVRVCGSAGTWCRESTDGARGSADGGRGGAGARCEGGGRSIALVLGVLLLLHLLQREQLGQLRQTVLRQLPHCLQRTVSKLREVAIRSTFTRVRGSGGPFPPGPGRHPRPQICGIRKLLRFRPTPRSKNIK